MGMRIMISSIFFSKNMWYCCAVVMVQLKFQVSKINKIYNKLNLHDENYFKSLVNINDSGKKLKIN